MLNVVTSSPRLGRRDFLRIGSLGVAGLCGSQLSLPALLAARANNSDFIRDKTVVFLFMQGGPSQHETFDPKLDTPVEKRTVTDVIETRVPDLQFGATFHNLAARADQLTVVRSFVPGDTKHDIKPLLNENTDRASVGALYARLAGATHERSGLPRSVYLNPRSADPECGTGTETFGKLNESGRLGAVYSPFTPGGGGPLQQSMRLELDRGRLGDRRALLDKLDDLKRSVDATGTIEGMDKFQQQAFQVIINGAADAFDLSKEDPRVVARYDTAPRLTANQIDRRWKNWQRYVDHNRSLGKLMLMTRRLVEAGVGFITVGTDFVWDAHADVNNAGVEDVMRYAGVAFDHAVGCFLDDLQARGLSDKVLLVCCGEMGRTPRINARGGRDHWGNVASLLLAGGGMPRGRIYGQSTRDGGDPERDPVTLKNLLGTIMHTAFDVPRLRLAPNIPNDLMRMATESDPIVF